MKKKILKMIVLASQIAALLAMKLMLLMYNTTRGEKKHCHSLSIGTSRLICYLTKKSNQSKQSTKAVKATRR